jgi:hypothetical protein
MTGKTVTCNQCGAKFVAQANAGQVQRQATSNAHATSQARQQTPSQPTPLKNTFQGDVIVTTGDLKEPYEIIGPVFFQVSNKGIFSSALSKLVAQYESEIEQMKSQGQMGPREFDWVNLLLEHSVNQTDFEKAFFVAVQELKKRAKAINAHAVISMRQDIDIDTNGFQYFYLQMYGTAVRL